MMKEKVRQSEYLLWEPWVERYLFVAELSLTTKPVVFSFHQAGMLLIWYSGNKYHSIRKFQFLTNEFIRFL